MGQRRERPGLLGQWHRQLYCALFQRGLARHPRQVVDGVTLHFPPQEARRVAEALALLRHADARRYLRLKRHLPVLTLSTVGTHFDATADAGCIDVALEGGAWPLAAALVHEATHAYLLKARGVPYEGQWRAWHEEMSLREERHVLRRLARHAGWPEPAVAAYLVRLEAQHREALAHAWWEAPLREQLRAARWHRWARAAS